MTIAQATLVQRIRWHLDDNPWETTGLAASGISAVEVADGTEWAVGEIGEFEEDGDTFYVRSIAGLDLTCTRGYHGSVGAAHDAGSRIFKNPRHKFYEITNAISEVIEYSLPWPEFYKIASTTITPDAASGTVWYDLDASALALVRAKQVHGTNDTRSRTYGARNKFQRIAFERSLDTGLVASGVGVAFPDGFAHVSNTVAIDYAAKITDTINSAQYVDFSAGEAVVAAIEYGAVALLQGSTILTLPRHATDEVDPVRGYSLFERLFLRARRQAAREIKQKHPLMKGWDNL